MDMTGAGASGRSAAIAWLVHPVTVTALVVLVVNDQLLKAWFPGVVTGKASDVAGLVLTPPVLAMVAVLLVPRLPARAAALGAVAVTGAGFVAVKAFPAGAQLASALWSMVAGSSVVRADPSDLLALPALGLAMWVASASPERGRATRRQLVAFALLPVVLLALAATNQVGPPPFIGLVAASPELVYQSESGPPESYRWLSVSPDGGQTWRALTPQEEAGAVPQALRSDPLARVTSACVPAAPNVCYRIQPGRSRVEQSTDGGASWQTVWELPEWQQRLLAHQYDGATAADVGAQSLAIQVRPGEGHTVIVACGRDGYLLGGTAVGQWRRMGLGTYVYDDGTRFDRPPSALPPLGPTPRPSDIPLTLMAAALVLIIGGIAAPRELTTTPKVLIVTVPFLVICGLLSAGNDTSDGLAELAGPAMWLATVALLGTAGTVFAIGFDGLRSRPVVLTSLATALGCGILLIGGSTELFDRAVGRWLALAWALLGLVLGAWLGARSTPVGAEPERGPVR